MNKASIYHIICISHCSSSNFPLFCSHAIWTVDQRPKPTNHCRAAAILIEALRSVLRSGWYCLSGWPPLDEEPSGTNHDKNLNRSFTEGWREYRVGGIGAIRIKRFLGDPGRHRSFNFNFCWRIYVCRNFLTWPLARRGADLLDFLLEAYSKWLQL